MNLNYSMNAAITAPSFTFFHAIRIELPGGSINLTTGNPVTFAVDGEAVTFTNLNPLAGTLNNIGAITEAIATSSPRVPISLLPKDDGGLAILCAADNQNSPVSYWFGLVDKTTGQVIGNPYRRWRGRYDTGKVTLSAQGRTVEIDTVSAWDRLFMPSEADRLNANWHKGIWGEDETGLDHNIAALADPYWGSDPPATAAAPISQADVQAAVRAALKR